MISYSILACLAVGMSSLLCAACLSAEEISGAQGWATEAFLGKKPVETPPAIGLVVRRQDYGDYLHLRQSVMNTPLQIGAVKFEHGVGTHAVSDILVRLPASAKTFKAKVGIDNNYDTKGEHGSVEFIVEVQGKEILRTPVLRGGQPPVDVNLDLGGARELVLRVTDGGDGPSHDQADWADALVVLADGRSIWLDELPVVEPQKGISGRLPFSFKYDGKPSAEFLQAWKRTEELPSTTGRRHKQTITWLDPASRLQLTCELTTFDDFPAVEWLLRFRNTGDADSPIIEDVRSLDMTLTTTAKADFRLNHSMGSTCEITDFLPLTDALPKGKSIRLSPHGGRSSNGCLPFWNLQWPGRGLVVAVGWSGQWEAVSDRDASGALRLLAGQQTTHFRLRPGESVRTPRMLVVFYRGDDPACGYNPFRQVLLAHYVPRHSGEVVTPPVTLNTWFVFNSGNDVTEANQLQVIEKLPAIGVEGFWLDAGWFEGGWPRGVGSWVPKKESFPRGLRPLGDESHKRGLKFVVWFEPERVAGGSRIDREYPNFVLRREKGDGLFNLGLPEAREWLTNFLSETIANAGIDVYRNDFNIDPLPFWRAADADDRKGVTEMHYVEGLYTMWDELLRRHPGLVIDNCASGGRRIDLETVSRSIPLWRSDTQCCGYPRTTWDQAQTAGLSLYVPLHAAGLWSFDPYACRSVMTQGASLCMDPRPADFPLAAGQRAIAEIKRLRPFFLGDIYHLLPLTTSAHDWCASQLDRPDLGQGIALFFRREESPYTTGEFTLRALDPDAKYEILYADTDRKILAPGKEACNLLVTMMQRPSSLLITYRKVAPTNVFADRPGKPASLKAGCPACPSAKTVASAE